MDVRDPFKEKVRNIILDRLQTNLNMAKEEAERISDILWEPIWRLGVQEYIHGARESSHLYQAIKKGLKAEAEIDVIEEILKLPLCAPCRRMIEAPELPGEQQMPP